MAKSTAPTYRGLPLRARMYVPGVAFVAAVAVVVETLVDPHSLDLSLLIVAGVLCAVANLFEVFAPGHYSFQPNLVFFFWAAVLLPPWATAVLALVCFLPGWIVHGFRWYMAAFNIANYALAGFVAHELAAEIAGPIASPDPMTTANVVLLMLAAIVFVALNHALIAVAVGFARSRPVRESVRDMADSVPLDVALALTGACLAVLWAASPSLALLATGPMLLIYRALWVPLLKHKSRTDPKTGLYNSEHLGKELTDAVGAARKQDAEVSVIMVDLDHLRVVNNRHGHLAGDRLLQGVAETVMEVVGEHAVAARFGGDEMCVVLPGRSSAEARDVAEELRSRVQDMTVDLDDGTNLETTVSAGIASYPRHGESVEALLHAADGAVYDAKLGGRNRVRLALPPGTREALNLGALPARPPHPVAHPDPGYVPLREVPKVEPPAQVVEELAEPTGARTNGSAAPVEEPPAPAAPSRRLIPWYAGLLCLAAVGVGVLSSPDQIVHSPELFALLVGSALGIDLVRISLFERANISPGSVPILALAAFFGPLGPLAAETLIAITRLLRREATVKWSFDLGALALAGAAAAWVFVAIPTDNKLAFMGVGILAGLVYYAVNVPLLAVVMGLAEGKSPLGPWRERLAWLWPHYGLFGALAAAFYISEQDLGLSVFAVFGLPVLVVWMSQKQYLDRSRSSVAALRTSHAELELANRQLRSLLDDNQALMRRMHRSYLSTITSLARTIEAKDPYTGGHTERVARLALALSAELEFNEEQLQAVNVGALIHDIGKIGISDQVLLKPGKLDESEFAEIRRHPEISSYIVADLELPPIVKQMVRSHHERYDGSGYPDALEGEEIPLAARILAVADALDAMTSDRPYRKALSIAVARDEIEKAAGTQFCPRVVAALRVCFARDPAFWDSLSAPEAGEPSSAARAAL